jgi:hypothetical protein
MSDLPTPVQHIEHGEQLLTRATAAYENSRRLDLLAITTGRPHDIERRNYLTAEAAALAQLATAHFAAARCQVGLDDTLPIDLVPLGQPAAAFEAGDMNQADLTIDEAHDMALLNGIPSGFCTCGKPWPMCREERDHRG